MEMFNVGGRVYLAALQAVGALNVKDSNEASEQELEEEVVIQSRAVGDLRH